MRIMILLIGVLFYNCENNPDRKNDHTKEKNLEEVIDYYDNGNIESKYFVDENNMVQGICTFYYENGHIKEIHRFHNDTTYGAISLYDDSGIITDKKSYYIDHRGEYSLSEYIEIYNDSLTGKQKAGGAFFRTDYSKNNNKTIFHFSPAFSNSYDSIYININYSKCKLNQEVYRFKYENFDIEFIDFENCESIEMIFFLVDNDYETSKIPNFNSKEKNITTVRRKVQRMYLIKNGEIETDSWIFVNDLFEYPIETEPSN